MLTLFTKHDTSQIACGKCGGESHKRAREVGQSDLGESVTHGVALLVYCRSGRCIIQQPPIFIKPIVKQGSSTYERYVNA